MEATKHVNLNYTREQPSRLTLEQISAGPLFAWRTSWIDDVVACLSRTAGCLADTTMVGSLLDDPIPPQRTFGQLHESDLRREYPPPGTPKWGPPKTSCAHRFREYPSASDERVGLPA
jgi:hypothetical protein